jgi:hypothetical protein
MKTQHPVWIDHCDYCGVKPKPKAKEPLYQYTCPMCMRPGCPECMPAGNGCICPACEEGKSD